MMLAVAQFVVAQLFVLEPPAGSAAVSTGVQAISPDGTVVGGQLSFPDGRTTGLVATLARGNVVVTDIGELSGGLDYTSVDALAADGTPFGTAFGANVVEPGDIDGVQVAFRFANHAFELLPDLTGGEGTTNVTDVSADGVVVVGASYPRLDGDFLPFVSVGGPAGTAEALPLRAGATRGDARAVSDDGRRIVCSDDLVTGGLALGYFVEREGDTWVLGAELPFSPVDVSGDGRVVVGARQRGENVVAVRVRVDTPEQIEELGELPGGVVSSEALATSEDGSVVVGRSASGVFADDPWSEEATWSGADGVLRRLADVATERGIDLSALDGGLLSQATALSADGLVVAGNAWIGPPGQAVVRGFVVVLPPVDDDDHDDGAQDGPTLHAPPTGGCSEGPGSPAPLLSLAWLLGRRRRRA